MGEIRARVMGTKVQPLADASSNAPFPVRSPPAEKKKIENPLQDEFDLSSVKSRSTETLPKDFTSPPLLEGLHASVLDVLGPNARPTPIQALSLKHLFSDSPSWRQYLLASETGSGKSIAYMLPMLHHLKQSELNPTPSPGTTPAGPRRAINPRALVLAPTHELSRQLSSFAKALLHNIKLRVLCVSRANTKSTPRDAFTASKMSGQFQAGDGGEFEVRKGGSTRPVDVLVGTPNRLLEMIHGRGWDREQDVKAEEVIPDLSKDRVRRAPWRPSEPEMGLQNVEWVIVDEADVLFDPDFQEHTRKLLADISAARGYPVEFTTELLPTPTEAGTPTTPISYPFNLLLTTATIPSSLASYLDTRHPSLTRLASPNLHHLPKSLKTEYENWTGGNKDADIERRIRRVWGEDSIGPDFNGVKSKILIFCNRSTKVESLGAFLKEKGIPNVALTSSGGVRKKGSNHHLDGFLRTRSGAKDTTTSSAENATPSGEEPHVMITTSLLSRGLDFSPEIKHVFIVDEPRNMIDFLHRAGRSGRAGQSGKVVVFGKLKGRGSERARGVRVKVGALRA